MLSKGALGQPIFEFLQSHGKSRLTQAMTECWVVNGEHFRMKSFRVMMECHVMMECYVTEDLASMGCVEASQGRPSQGTFRGAPKMCTPPSMPLWVSLWHRGVIVNS